MNASELLANTLSSDATTRQAAEEKLDSASRENYLAYMLMLSAELVNDSSQSHVRNAAGLALKNAISAKETTRQQEYSARWLAIDAPMRKQIKDRALHALASSNGKVGQVAAQFIAAIAAVELPVGQWQELIDTLLGFMNDQSSHAQLRIATLQAIGYICESIKPEILAVKSNEILTAVIHGARKEEAPEVQHSAIQALYNSLEFVRDNFEREGERNYIMQIVCEATQSNATNVQIGAFECLVKIMSLYYDKMAFYMERALFGLTVMGMKHSDEQIALQAIEFWSTVCETETEYAWEAAEAHEYGEIPENESRFFAKIALPEIMPVLLTLLTRQEEEYDEDEWNVSMAAGTCLGLLAQAVADTVVPAVIPFIEANIRSADWHQREAAVMAFGSILEGPDPAVLMPLVNQALQILLDMMADSNVHVKDTVAWTLGRICDHLIGSIKPDVHLHPLVSALVRGLQDNPRVAANCCWALLNLAEQLSFSEGDDQPQSQSNPLSPYYEGIVQALLQITETASNEGNFRTAAYECVVAYVTHSTPDCIPVVQNTAVAILTRMEQLLTMENQILGTDDRNNWNELQSAFCSVISVIRKLGQGVQPLADRIMTLILSLIQRASKTSTVLEDTFLVVGSLASALEQNFSPYMSAFLPSLYPALKAHEDAQLCTVAIGVIGDLSRSLGDQTAQYANAFMSVLLENLQSDVLNRNVKITILSCFGDIALAIGPAFEPFLTTTVGVLRQAGSVTPNPLDIELVEYVTQLREGILEAYTGIVGGFKGTDKVSLLLPHAGTILELIQRCLADGDRTETTVRLAIGLIGDLADSFPNGEIKQLLLTEWIAAELRSKGRGQSPETKRTLKWARDVVKRATA
ncbi:armadillo-type protein [Irpex rosettiformis]|uniref:Armadillo-type protein n=1 Tax=Irpex rosettiformis TaxID=378272 RepID=A0ACB8UD75_9APHY|nr:armadillo-type protein [Irpex rosettiformis]